MIWKDLSSLDAATFAALVQLSVVDATFHDPPNERRMGAVDPVILVMSLSGVSIECGRSSP